MTRARYKDGVLAAKTLRDKAILDKDFPSLKLYLSQYARDGQRRAGQSIQVLMASLIQMDVDTHWTIEVME